MKNVFVFILGLGLFLALSCQLYSFESQKDSRIIGANQNYNSTTTAFKSKQGSTHPVCKNDILSCDDDNEEYFSSAKKNTSYYPEFCSTNKRILLQFILTPSKIYNCLNFSRLPRFNYISFGVLRI